MTLPSSSATSPRQYLPLDIPLSATAQRLYDTLIGVARRVADTRGYCAAVSQVHFFCPGEIVADALGMARSTLYRKLAELKAADLIDARAHYVTHEGRTRADGMVWCVKMHPNRSGRVSVPYDALKASYRCLSADIESGRTAWKQIGQSKEPQEKQDSIEKILAWALPSITIQNPITNMTVRRDLEQVLDIPFAVKEDVNTAVDGAARAMASALGDAGGLMFYRWLLWQLLRLETVGVDAPWYGVYEQVRRAEVDVKEGFAKNGNGGALFVARLKSGPWWDELRSVAHVRVGRVPMKA
jgi:hypothetical protein